MRKKVLLIIAALAAVSLSGCGRQADEFTQEKYEEILFGQKVPAEYEGQYRIGVKCNSPNSKCEFTVYRVKNSEYEVVFSCPGTIGKNGAGKIAEGDMKTPCGTFTVGNAYGIKDDPGSRIPYTKVTEDLYWRGNSAKADYNKLVSSNRLPANTDFSNDEHLISYAKEGDGVYNYFLDIGYNPDCAPYAGSAVFLHCWRNADAPTAGCIAISEENMIKTLRTITPGTQITVY